MLILIPSEWDAAKWSSVILAVITFLYTLGTFLLWYTTYQSVKLTKKSIDLLTEQVKLGIASNYSSSQHRVFDAHRDLYSSILSNPALFEVYVRETGKHKDSLVTQMLATFLINHCFSIFSDFESGVLNQAEFESFIVDAKDMFQAEFLRKRWKTVKEFHPPSFRSFVEEKVLTPDAVLLDLAPRSAPIPR